MTVPRTNLLSIQTPEGISFSFVLAGPFVRFLAWSIDLGCIAAASFFVNSFLSVLGFISSDLAAAAGVLSYFVLSVGYGITMEWYWRGQTLGKKLLRLRVMDVEGLRLEFSQVMLRNLLRCVDILPLMYLVGGVACFLSRRAQRLGDFAANTIVVRHPKIREPDVDQLVSGKFNSLRHFPHLAARLRQHVSPVEANIALQALLRREEFDPAARVELFQAIRAHFQSLVDFPLEAVEGITDEQYIRNVVDIIYRPRTTSAEALALNLSRQG
jgi:uncharacterized RDD family membrane protein YckC